MGEVVKYVAEPLGKPVPDGITRVYMPGDRSRIVWASCNLPNGIGWTCYTDGEWLFDWDGDRYSDLVVLPEHLAFLTYLTGLLAASTSDRRDGQ
jgi:hypothetical protein